MERNFLLCAAIFLALPSVAPSQERLEGWFIAKDQCEAYQSKNQLTSAHPESSKQLS